MFNALRFIQDFYKFRKLKWDINSARELLSGPFAWHALDRLSVPGHGTSLLRLDFPPKSEPVPRWGYDSPRHSRLGRIFDASLPDQDRNLQSILGYCNEYHSWPNDQLCDAPTKPWRNNQFMPPLDALSLYAFFSELRPDRYIEIGSGVSTRIAALAKEHAKLDTEIISIDPCPRVEVKQLCNQSIRHRLEDVGILRFLDLVTKDSIIFFDGSHHSFPGNDVTIFLLDILPELPKGAVVQIHDIYLPNDYPSKAMNFFWSEQYLLAMYLLGGGGNVQILFSSAYAESNEQLESSIKSQLGQDSLGSCSLWLRIV